MDKIIHLESHFPSGELTVQPVMLWANGRACYEGISKHASVGHDFFKTVTPVPGHSFVYVLAVSGWEYYGENRNGDGFPEFPYMETANPPWIAADETLPHYYKTFEEFGNNFRHHCFPAGTPVLMADRTRKAIEEVEVGDRVVTLKGPKKVSQVSKRAYAGIGVQLRLRGNYEELIATEDHPVLVYRREDVHCPHKYNRLTPGTGCRHSACQDSKGTIGVPEWAPMSSVLPGDYLVLPIPEHGQREIPVKFAQLVGWVASEGYLNDKGGIQFTFSENNQEDIDAVTACLRANKLYVGHNPRPQYEVVQVSANSVDTSAILQRYIQGVLSEKTLTSKVLEWDEQSLLHLLGAYIDGDGHVCQKGKNAGQLRIRSSSPAMLRILADVIRSLGVPATVQWDSGPHWMLAPTNHQKYFCEGSGVVTVNATDSVYIAQYIRKKFDSKSERLQPQTRVGNTFLVQVTEKEEVALEENVYNLEVEDEHHYVANEVVVHNCNKDPDKAVGKVVKAFWNPPMHRVELLIDLDNAKAPDLADRIAAGEYPPVSMGCRVPYDTCNICGNRAPTRAQYCNHLRFQMRDVINGKKVCALNPRPKFFDISWVFRPADPIAFMMKKVAEERPYEITGAAAGEYLNKMSSLKDAAHKVAVIDKLVQGLPVDARSAGMNEVELDNMKKCVPLAVQLGRAAVDLPDNLLNGMSSLSMPQIFSTMAARGMQPTTPEVVKITIIKVYNSSPAPEVLDRSVALQGSIFGLLEDHPQIIQQLMDSGALSMGPQHVHRGLFDLLGPLMEKRSGMGEYLKRRIVPENWRDETPYTTPMSLTDPATGQAYATTRGAAIAAHDEIAKRNLYKVVGGTALLGGAYKVIGHGLGPGRAWMKPLVAAGLGAAGLSQLPDMGPHYMTDQGIPIPTNTELAKVSSLGGYALPLVGALGTMALMGQDYNSRLQDGIPIGYPGLPMSRRVLDQAEESANEHPIIAAGVGTLGLGMLGRSGAGRWAGKRLVNPVVDIGSDIVGGVKGMANRAMCKGVKLSEWLANELPTSQDTVTLPNVDLDKLAERIGEWIVEG